MGKQGIAGRLREIAEEVATRREIELVHIEIAGTKRDSVVRIYIDKPEGVTLDDCSLFSRDVEEVMDLEDVIPSRYVLEVSSPGIERELYSLDDFRRFAGKLAKVKTNVEIDGQRTFVGTITSIEDDTITLTLDDRTKGEISFSYGDVAKANLKIDLSKEFHGR
jgi:ribosome maturation factor RimP